MARPTPPALRVRLRCLRPRISGASTHRPTDELPHDPMYQALREFERRGLVRFDADEFMVQAWTIAVFLTDHGKAIAQDASFIDGLSPILLPYPQP